jgi:hypothetical protein
MSVYYVRSPDTGLVKIGFAQDPWSRLCKMQVDSPARLVLAAVEDGGKAIEAERHRQFADLRRRGEWFECTAALEDHIDSLPAFQRPPRRGRIAGPLGEWINSHGHTLVTFAELAATSEATLSRVCDGKQFPRRALMLRIVEATNWEVDANMLLGIPTKPRAAAA